MSKDSKPTESISAKEAAELTDGREREIPQICEMELEPTTSQFIAPGRESVEKIPLGHLGLSFVASHVDPEVVGTLANALSAIIDEIREEQDLIITYVLRLVEVTSDFRSERARWEQELGRPEEAIQYLEKTPDANPEGTTVGVTLLWGDGEPKTTYAVIILDDQVALPLADAELDDFGLAKAVLAHELGHVEVEYLSLCCLGPDSEVFHTDWHDIRHTLARAMWEECFADFVSYSYCQTGLDTDIGLFGEILNGFLRRIEDASGDFCNPELIDSRWKRTISELGGVFNQLARTVGSLAAARLLGDDQFDRLYALVDEAAPAWGQVVRQATEELDGLLGKSKWALEDFWGLEEVVERGLGASGLRVQPIEGRRLAISVVPPDPSAGSPLERRE